MLTSFRRARRPGALCRLLLPGDGLLPGQSRLFRLQTILIRRRREKLKRETGHGYDPRKTSGCHLFLSFAVQAKPQVVRFLTGHTAWINSAAFSPDGRYLLSGGCEKQDYASGCTEGSIKIWDAASGSELFDFPGPTGYVSSVAFSPDSRFALWGSSEKTVELWDLSVLMKPKKAQP